MASEYPNKVHVSVALLDGMIVNYKTSSVGRYWDNPYGITWRGEISVEDIPRVETQYTTFEVNSAEENNLVFSDLAIEWLKQWEIHPQYRVKLPSDYK